MLIEQETSSLCFETYIIAQNCSIVPNHCSLRADEIKLCLTPSAKQRRNPCSGLPAVYPDLSTRHDWPVKKGLCFVCRIVCTQAKSLRRREKQNQASLVYYSTISSPLIKGKVNSAIFQKYARTQTVQKHGIYRILLVLVPL